MGIFLYLDTTRPNISFSIGIVSRFMKKSYEGHWSTTKRVVKYLKETKYFGLEYSKVDHFKLIG